MKMRSEFLAHTDGEEAFIVPTDSSKFSGLVRGNKALGDITTLLQNDITEQEIVHALHEKYDAPDGVIERDVKKALDILREIGALDEI